MMIRLPKLPHLPFWAWTLGGVLIVLMVNAAVTLPSYTTTKKEFCITCHRHQREPSFWDESTLHPKINCSECHATGHALMPSINIFPLESGGEHAGFSAKLDQINPNCVRCHPEVFRIERTSPSLNPFSISIPHRFHVEQLKNACTACHYNIYHDPHEPPTFRPPKEACFECHERDRTGCGTCHPKGAIPLPKTADISHSECAKCHQGFEDAKIKIYDLPFPHRKHIARILDCTTCHASGEQHGKIIKTRVECLNCHHRAGAKCPDCHERQAQFIRGESLGEKEAQPDAMAEGVHCSDCHTTIARGHSPAEVKKACIPCHDAGYEGLPDTWQTETIQAMTKLRKEMTALKARKDRFEVERKQVIGEVERVLTAIERDKSHGAHNVLYATKLLSQAEQKLLDALE